MTMSDDIKRIRLPFVSTEGGPKKAGPAVELYDPMRASSRQARVEASFYQGDANKAALARRIGFPSYLTMKRDPQ